jgi:hypothetical protein
VHFQGQLYRHIGRVGMAERIVLPLADDGAHADGIIGATTYSLPATLGLADTRGERIQQQRYVFYDLEPVANDTNEQSLADA